MAQASAQLNELRQSPRKVRLVADYMRGKRVEDVLNGLKFLDKRASEPLLKLLQSAISNAKSQDIAIENLFVKEITVNSGGMLWRRRAGSRGRAMPIRKKMSRIMLVLGEKEAKKVKGQKAKGKSEVQKPKAKAAKKTEKKED